MSVFGSNPSLVEGALTPVSTQSHWDDVYGRKAVDAVSWFRPHLETSLGFLKGAKLGPDASIIDVGGGASTFVDDALELGFSNITVLDLAEGSLKAAGARLGPRGDRVNWMVADITRVALPARSFDFWHDRAVFHFLTDPADRARYVAQARAALKPGGFIVVATFAPDGPEKCSGLEVARFTAEGIHDEFGATFEKVGEAREVHETPWGSEQAFSYCYCRVS
ncbi:MAG: class I SAM-dependent methyltransferase [Polyangiaceae bacterium]